jgi:hypothetical protein
MFAHQETTMHAWLCEQPTGVDALRWQELPTPEPGPKQVRVAIRAASLNFPDILIVQNKYQFKPEPPFVPGSEYAGVVEAVGSEVKGLQPGAGAAMAARRLRHPRGARGVACSRCRRAFRRGRRRVRLHIWDSYHALIDRAALKAGETVFVLVPPAAWAPRRCRSPKRWRARDRRRLERREGRALPLDRRRRDDQLRDRQHPRRSEADH